MREIKCDIYRSCDNTLYDKKYFYILASPLNTTSSFLFVSIWHDLDHIWSHVYLLKGYDEQE